MKSSTRSHRLSHSTTDPPDDWVDGSWTVDCICGVNFDDGEEMVDCDICGVWVHTRCSRYVKGETSFACHKCKAKNPRTNNKATITTSSNSNVDTEETEVAQLLIELPTKTIKTKTHDPAPCPLNNAPPPPRRPYGFWAERPYEERVHVQGVPGGDPSLFEGLPSSSIFTPQLWKCTGYIPKKLTVQYREFPEWGDPQQQEPDAAAAAANFEENCNNNLAENGGGGVLYPLSKDAAEETSPLTPGGLATGAQQENTLPSRKASRDTKSKSQHVNDNKESVNVVKKERSLLRPVALQYGTRKREDIGGSKERVGRKKPKEIVKEFVTKKDKSVGPKSAVSPSIRSSYFGNGQDNDRKLLKLGILDSKHGHGRDTGGEDASDFHLEVEVDHPTEKPKSTSLENISEALSSEVTGHDYSADKGDNLGKVDQPSSHPVKGSPKVDVVFPSMVDDVAGTYLAVDKGKTIDDTEIGAGTYSEATAVDLQRSESLLKDVTSASPDVKDNEFLEKPDADLLSSSHNGTKTEENAVVDGSRAPLKSDSVDNEVKMVDMDDLTQNTVSSPHISGDYKARDAGATDSKLNEHKTQEVDSCSAAASDCSIAKASESYWESLPARQTLDEQECNIDTPKAVFVTGEDTPKFVSESNQSPIVVEDKSTLDGPISCHPLSSSQTKSAAILRSSSNSSSIVVSKPPLDKSRTSNSGTNILVKEQVLSKANSNGKKDMPNSSLTWDEDRHESMKLTPKEGPKSSGHPPSRALHQSKADSLNASKASSLDEDDISGYTSCKASSVQGNPYRSRSGELVGSSQNQGTKKGSTSALHPRGQRVVLSNSQSSSKATYSSSVQTPVSTNCPAGLSDEELALLLHQELNSSPRVPRVPRMRHGGLTQLSSAAASTLVKRTSGAGGKEQYLFSRRKSKDVRSSQVLDNDRQKKDKLPSSPDSARTGDAPNQVEDNSESLTLVQKSVPHASVTVTDRVPSSIYANERKFSPKRSSPKSNSDDETTSKGPVHRTLPALIARIMSKGRRMTYEELCNAVLPHWPTLRKHNGERYAYSSHSQAVLDCLRNRSEWARLVDRGPKTNPSRKRRKSDTGPPNTEESEDNGSGHNASSKDIEWTNLEANAEEYPKGKRNLRKRRQLALQGRVVKYSRKRRKTEVASDDGSGSFSGSTESESSEEESQGHETREASGSSDETTAML